MSSLQGMTLGQYRIIEQIGRGGMATVYKAYQPGLDRYVAIKVLPPYYAHEEGFVERFKQEARSVARLRHPNILTVYDFGEAEGLTYIVMEFVEGGTLKERLSRPLALDDAVALIIQVARALDHAHSEGIIHRDVKPSNVLLPRENWALLTDFGIAKVVESTLALTKTGVGIGTPEYMSPEQGQGMKLDGRSDIYSLGVVLYEMATGRMPFTADTPFAIVLKHMTEPLPLPRQINPNISESIERVVLRAMAKEPVDRFQTAGEMVQALEAIRIAGDVAAPPRRPPIETEVIPPRRRPLTPPPPVVERRQFNLMWLVAPVLALLLLGGGFWALSNRSSSPRITPTVSGTSVVIARSTEVATSTLAPTALAAGGATSVPTRTPTKAPTREPTPVPPTATLRPTSLPMAATTAAPRPTRTPTTAPPTATLKPTDTPTTVPPTATEAVVLVVPTATPRPLPTATPRGRPAVVLQAPEDAAQLQGQVTFRWTWAVNLGSGEVFDVRVCKGEGCEPRFGKTNTGDTTWVWQPDEGGGTYRWQVVVIRKEGDRVVAEQAHSAVWVFEWSGGGPPGPHPTPVPLPTRPP